MEFRYAGWTGRHGSNHTYLDIDGLSFGNIVLKFFTFFLLNAAFVPVSLYVSMKMARTVRPLPPSLPSSLPLSVQLVSLLHPVSVSSTGSTLLHGEGPGDVP